MCSAKRHVRFTPESGHLPFIRSPRGASAVIAGIVSREVLLVGALPTLVGKVLRKAVQDAERMLY
jgi:hypothetical protein